VAGEGAATGAELYVGHGTVWVNGDNGYIAMQVSGLEVLPGAGLTDSGLIQSHLAVYPTTCLIRKFLFLYKTNTPPIQTC